MTDQPEHDFSIQRVEEETGREALVEVAAERAAQEVQAAMVVARRFPRDENKAFTRIMQSCQRKKLAEQATYAYPRGGSMVTGPSIRLAEALAQGWGNIDFGILELEQREGESTVMAYCWDLETGTRQTKVFQVPHVRQTKDGLKSLTDPRDIYEMVANQGARRLRACILGVIPGDVVDAAVEQCQKTLTSGHKEPLKDRIRKLAATFGNEFGVGQSMLEARLGHKLDVTSEQEMVQLRAVYRSLKDGMAQVGDFFGAPPEQAKAQQESLKEKAKKASGQKGDDDEA